MVDPRASGQWCLTDELPIRRAFGAKTTSKMEISHFTCGIGMRNIEVFVGRVNTQAAEQANNVLKKRGWFMNRLEPENFVSLFWYEI